MKEKFSAGWKETKIYFVGSKNKVNYKAKLHRICNTHSIKDILRIPKGDNTC